MYISHNELGLPAGPTLHKGASSPENSITGLKTKTFLKVCQMPYLIFFFNFGYLLVEKFVSQLSYIDMK